MNKNSATKSAPAQNAAAQNISAQKNSAQIGLSEVKKYRPTIFACFFGYVTQSIVNTFVSLLFLTFEQEFGIPLAQITALITVNFALQLCIDFASAFFIDKIGYRACAIAANAFSAAGLIGLVVLPDLLTSKFAGLLIAVLLYAIGGGLLEVVISPIVEACPSERKEQTMSLLHSFYCWGCLGVALLSTAFFFAFGTANWRILAALWAIIPAANAVFFAFVPVKNLQSENGGGVFALLKNPKFWLFALIILCSGASEQAISQWASALAEQTLNGNKTLGDLLGPAVFAACMGASRLLYGKSKTANLETLMLISGAGCLLCYFLIALIPSPIVAFAAMGLSGFSVGILWPGSLSSAANKVGGGNAMFALLALAGDLGCMCGPSLAGLVSSAAGDNLKVGVLVSAVFPAALILCLIAAKRSSKKKA